MIHIRKYLYLLLLNSSSLLYTAQVAIANELKTHRTTLASTVDAFKGLKTELAGIHGSLQQQLITELDTTIKEMYQNIDSVKGPLDLIRKNLGDGVIKDIVLHVGIIPDLDTTLAWILDNPMTSIKNHLFEVRKSFVAVGEKFNPADPKAAALYSNIDTAITKLQSAKDRLDQLIQAIG